MIATQRRREIVALVHSGGSAKVSDLARSLDVTEETIRRDLRDLADQGQLIRTHGGALALETDDGRADLPYHHRITIDQPQKIAIATEALRLIKPGQIIALDASSTTCELAYRLPDQPLTVVTNSLVICSALARKTSITTVCTGGRLDPTALAFHGPHAERAIDAHNIHHAFISCRGIEPARGLSEASDTHAAMKLGFMNAAQHTTLLADPSKLGLASAVFFAPPTAADLLITNQSNDRRAKQTLTQLRNMGIKICEVQADG